MSTTDHLDLPLDGVPAAATSNGNGGTSAIPPADRAPKASRGRPRKATATGAPAASTRGPGRPPKPKLDEKLTDQFVMIGVAVGAAGVRGWDGQNPTPLMLDSSAIIAGAPRLAGALVKLGEENPAVKRALERLVTVSAYGELIGAVAAIAIPIAANHGLLPDGVAGLAGVMSEAPEQEPAGAGA